MKNWIYVFLGGMLGAFLRFIVQSLTATTTMLWIVNIIGSFLLGSLNGYYESKKVTKSKLFLTTGMLGAFTTFSTFSESWFYQLQENIVMGLLFGFGMTITSVLAALVGFLFFKR